MSVLVYFVGGRRGGLASRKLVMSLKMNQNQRSLKNPGSNVVLVA